jgi:streptogramin lyase
MPSFVRVFPAVGLVTLSILLTGCTLATTDTTAAAVLGGHISGSVHGGQQPIYNAKVYLLAVNPNAYGGPGIAASSNNASISLLKASATGNTTDTIGSYVTTDTNGNFSISSDYSCTSGFIQGTTTAAQPYSANQTAGSEQVYLYALGGFPTNPATTANSASGFLVALGPCNGLSSSNSFNVNEITTVATAYALAGFATDATHIGSSGSTLAINNLSNAFANVANLINTNTGAVVASTTTIVRPVPNLITLANLLASCVNTTSSTSTQCTSSFAVMKSSGTTGTTPTDTATAIINLAHNPYPSDAAITTLWNNAQGTNPTFAGGITTYQPNDYTLMLQFTGNGLSQPWGLAIDAAGSAWAVNYDYGSTSAATLSKFSSTGAPLVNTSTYTLEVPYEIAIDTSGNAWVANGYNPSSVTEFSNAGTPITGPGSYTGGGLSNSYGIAIDASGDAWISNTGNGSIAEFNSSGTELSGLGFGSPDSSTPQGVAIDVSGAVWFTNYRGSSITKLNSSGVYQSGMNGYTGGGLNTGARGIAIDASGNAWIANPTGYTISEFSNSGMPLSGTNGFSGGGLNGPFDVAIDGAGTVWLCNNAYSSVSAFIGTGASAGTAISPASTAYNSNGGYTGTYYNGTGTLSQPANIAIDGAGDVWISNYGNNSLTEMVGAGAPVVTPLAANLVTPYGTHAVNLP